MTATGRKPTTTKFVNEHSTIWPNRQFVIAELWVLICTVQLTVCSCHVKYVFQSKSTLYSCLNVEKLLDRNMREIWSLTDSNGTRTPNNLIGKKALNTLTKLNKWLRWDVSTYLYGGFHCTFLSCHVRVSDWIHTLFAWMSRNSLLETCTEI